MISKTLFINYLRCSRYCALEEIKNKRSRSIVTIDGLIAYEDNEKKRILLQSMYDEETDEDLLEQVDEQLETLMPYYRKIELLSGNAIDKFFGGNVIYGLNTYSQKRFECYYNDIKFFCFLDGFQEDASGFKIFETKATTDKKFLKLGYTKDKEFFGIFAKNEFGFLELKEKYDDRLLKDKDYIKNRDKLKDRLHDCGKYVYDLAYQRFVIENGGMIQNPDKLRFFLVVLNSDYVYDGEVTETGDQIYQTDIVSFIDLTEITKEMMPILKDDFEVVTQNFEAMNADKCQVGKQCERKKLRQCKFFDICFQDIPKLNSIFTYMGGHFGFGPDKIPSIELVNMGYYKAEDIPYDWLRQENDKIQRFCIDNKIPFINHSKIKEGLSLLKYPIYHLDFETFPCPLPRFKGEKPYTQSLFQFSIHVERKPGICDEAKDHYEYLASDHSDLRKDLLNRMIECIKDDNGTVLVYNEAFERTRLKEMAEMFPDLSAKILNIRERIFDLMHLVKTNSSLYLALGFSPDDAKKVNYYHEKLNGSYSIKKVLPVFSNLTYEGMEIKNGTQALVTYAKFPYMKKNEFEHKYQKLLAYCKQDTYAMVVVLEGIRELMNE